jgi:stage V sporulation protein D (sporulation-specific penicillin-binding protein)
VKHRAGGRLLHLQIAAIGGGLILLARLVAVQLVGHAEYLALAEAQWRHREELAPERGNIYDRNGRPLALSATTWRVGVAASQARRPEALAGRLARCLPVDSARIVARIRAPRGGHFVVEKEAVLRRGALDSLRQTDGITLEPLCDRIYPLDGAGASLIGFHREDPHGSLSTGLERSLGATLSGEPGAAWRLDSARPDRPLGTIVLQEPVHGHHLLLTIDADVQQLCEEELALAVQECGARGGAVVVVEPQSGEIVAVAASPLIRERQHSGNDLAVWNNFALTGIFEPGSVFKIFSSAVLLRHGAIDSTTVYDCSNDNFGSFRIHNSEGHSYGPLNFMQAFAKSSNIWFARAAGRLSPDDMYRGLRDFGFGACTRVPYQSEPAGILRRPAQWSARSLPTIAIGQEVAVTSLQLAMAGAAIANGGRLLAPRIVREVRDHDHAVMERGEPLVVRKVLTPEQARLVRLAMQRVVETGTGRAAAVPWTKTGGKTGTAQKAEPGRGYLPGKYMASFLGIVPVETPRLVVLAVLDEPDAAHHYASQSAAPLFGRLVEGIRRSTDWLTGVEGPDPALTLAPRPTPTASVPDVLYLSLPAAAQELRRAGFVLGGGERGGWVVEQVPDGGARCAPGDTVWVTAAAERAVAAAPGQVCPDLGGLSNRQVGRLAARLGLPIVVHGAGYVVGQEPVAGASLAGVGAVTVVMESRWR